MLYVCKVVRLINTYILLGELPSENILAERYANEFDAISNDDEDSTRGNPNPKNKSIIRSNTCDDLISINLKKIITIKDNDDTKLNSLKIDSTSIDYLPFQSMPDISPENKKENKSVGKKTTNCTTISPYKGDVNEKQVQKEENYFQTIREKYDGII